MKSRSQSTTSLKGVLVILLGVFGVAAAGVSAAADQLGWKIVPDPEIVNFKRADAKVVTQTLVAPPFLPEHTQVASGPPRIVKIRMDIVEREVEIAPGAFVWQMAFNNSVPGPVPVVHQYDWVELTLYNGASREAGFTVNDGSGPNVMLHNVDFHASTGALGGGRLTQVLPGQVVVLTWRAVKAGLFVYHCAPGGAMVPLHVVSGMNGAIMVLPRDGLKDEKGHAVRYDRAYYIGEQDFYIPRDESGMYKSYSSPAAGFGEMLKVMATLTPTHIVFNGSVAALTGENALKARVGEKVLFIHSQANRDSRVHLIGGHGDLVWPGGSFADMPATNLETWPVPSGTAVAMLYEFRQPGLYAYLNHNLIEAFLLGAAAHVNVEGTWNDDLMKQVRPPGPIREQSR